MPKSQNPSILKKFRISAGLTVRELAIAIGVNHSNVVYWENQNKLPRSDVLIDMAKALGVSVEELLGQPKPRPITTPKGKARQLFEEVGKLPRSQQQRILGTVEDMLFAQQSKTAS